MKRDRHTTPGRHTARERGSVLVIVLWIALGLVGLALYFADSMALELRAADNRAAGISADEAIEGAKRYVSSVLASYATNGVMPSLSDYRAEAVPVGDARFWIIGRDNSDPPAHPNQVTFGLIDEASKLNLNTASTNRLMNLTRMTADFAYAILDWRGTRGGGGSDLYYSMLGYQCKHAPFETVDELALVYGATADILSGNDYNRNGILDPNERADTFSGQLDPGLLDLTTVYSREPNIHSDGTPRTNIRNAGQLRGLLRDRFGESRANQVITRLGNLQSLQSLLDFYLRSGLSADEFAQIYKDIRRSGADYSSGRVNINTAPLAVLACLPGVDLDTARQLAAYRQNNPDRLTSIAWIVDALGANSPAIQTLRTGDYINNQSFQFTADIAAVGPFGRGYRRVKFVFDLSDGSPRIVYRQDLTHLGWALGEDVRQTYVVKATP